MAWQCYTWLSRGRRGGLPVASKTSPPSISIYTNIHKYHNQHSTTMLSFYPRLCFLALILHSASVCANTEKVIFLAPSPFQVPTAPPTIDELHLETLTPQRSSLRTHLHAQFPTDSAKYGVATWVLLDQLKEGQRYEVRVCWAATVSLGLLSLCFHRRFRHVIYLICSFATFILSITMNNFPTNSPCSNQLPSV